MTSIAQNWKTLRAAHAVMRADKPLAVGASKQLAEMHPELSSEDIQAVMRRHTKTDTYLRNIKFGTVRFNLDGTEAGEITQEQRTITRLHLNERSTRRAYAKKVAKKINDPAYKKAKRELHYTAKLTKIQAKIKEAVSALGVK